MINEIKSILSDGCTRSPDFNFKECCEEHDYYYSTGEISRKEADKQLRKCIAQKRSFLGLKYKLVPWIYWAAVRLFGGVRYKNE